MSKNLTTKSFRILGEGIDILDKYGPDSDNFTEFKNKNRENVKLLEMIDNLAWFKKRVNEDPDFLKDYPKRKEIIIGFLLMTIFFGILTALIMWAPKLFCG